MKTIAVTGATGMIGRHIVSMLSDRGYTVRALVRQTPSLEGDVKAVRGDLNSDDTLLELLDGAHAVFHCAAELRDSSRMHAVNVLAAERLAQLATASGISFFCHLSSAGVVGPAREFWVDESTPCRPSNPYECSKWEAEQRLLKLPHHAMRLCLLRPTNVIDDDRPGILNLAVDDSWKSWLHLFFKGGECAHLVHAKDVAAAALHLFTHDDCSGVYICGCDEETGNRVSDVVNVCRNMSGESISAPPSLPVNIPYFLRIFMRGRSLHGDTRFSSARLKACGFEFSLGLEGSIRSVCQYHKDQTS